MATMRFSRGLLLISMLGLASDANAQRIRIAIKKPRIVVGSKPLKPLADAVAKGVNDIGKTVGKAGTDTWAETTRTGVHLVEAGAALVQFVEAQATGTVKVVSDSERRIREGKFADALFHAAYDPWVVQQEAAFDATQQSPLLSTLGGIAASSGGPGGTAAYAAWQAYRTTNGNAELAVRAGIIAGLTHTASAGVARMDAGAARKAVMAGAIGGMAVAASGGDRVAVEQGFLWAGGMVLVQDGYRSMTGHPLDARPSTEPPLCISSTDVTGCEALRTAYVRDTQGKVVRDATGNPKVDMSKLPRNAQHVGVQNDGVNPDARVASWKNDNSVVMRAVSQVPGMNAMGLFHDQWVASWDMTAMQNQASIPPAIILTYVGTGAPLFDVIRKAGRGAVSGAVSEASGSLPVGGATPPGTVGDGSRGDETELVRLCSYDVRLADGTVERPAQNSCRLEDFLGGSLDLRRTPDSIRVLDSDGHLVPGAAWEWADPLDSTSTATTLRPTVRRSGNPNWIAPAERWTWTILDDSTSYSVSPRAYGLVPRVDGRFDLAPGWEWVDPQDTTSTQMRVTRGLELLPNGHFRPTFGWQWTNPTDDDDLSVRRVSASP